MKVSSEKFILLDADVIIHFYKGEAILKLKQIFPKRLLILDKVEEELNKHYEFRSVLDNLINLKIITSIPFPERNVAILREYSQLIKSAKGKGESACMAYCRFEKQIIASSNWRDIVPYCQLHGIEYLSTMDFLQEAYEQQIMDEASCDLFIYNVLSKKSKLPFPTMKAYWDSQKK
jgi:hypothetical protein